MGKTIIDRFGNVFHRQRDGVYIPNFICQKDVVVPAGFIKLTLTNILTGKQTIEYYKNLFTTVGKESLAQAIRGVIASSQGIITYCALGLDDTAPALGNTALGNELFRKLVSVRSTSNNQALFETFFTTSEANGALKEAGLFGDDAGESADSGTLFCHAAINRTKSANDTLSLQWTVIIG